jgi:hypothetical protein
MSYQPATLWEVVRTHFAALTHDFRGFCRWLDHNGLTIGPGYKVVRKRAAQPPGDVP